jgi:acyl-CoA synthetase (AMP-forming)/AMP-acid ligase II
MTTDFPSLVEMLRHRAATAGDTIAYTFLVDGEHEGDAITYGQLDRRARAIAATLQGRGLEAGSRALLLYPPGLDFIAAFFGCLYAGVVAVPSYPPHPAQVSRALPRLLAITCDAEVSVVLCSEPVAVMAPAVAALAPALATLAWLATDEIDERRAMAWQAPPLDANALAFLQYTSGSTAAPKGVMVSQANLLHNLGYANYVEENDGTSVSVSWLPVIHDMGLIEGVLEPAFAGYPAYLMAPASFLQRPIRWLQAITRYRATNSGGPNFAYDLCVRKIGAAQREPLDLSTWRVAYNGAEPIRRDTLVAFHDSFARHGFRWNAFYPVYGLAEATLVVSSGRRDYEPRFVDADTAALREGRAPATPLVSCGPAGCGTRVVIVDPDTSEPCPDDSVGEIWVASPSVARGYWNRPAETRRTFHAHLCDGAGPFLRTGDLGVLRDGEVVVTGRLKDLLIVRGLKHYPQDIELTAERSDAAVRAGCVAAFAVDVDGAENVVVAAEIDPRRLSATIGDDGACHAIATAIRRAVAEQHGIQLHAVVLLSIGALPKTSSGKLRRHACRSAFDDGTLDELHRWTHAALTVT